MKLFLDQFEQQIDETILKRGLNYFKKGHVTDMEETGNGQYEFTVEGSDTYTVLLETKGNTVTHCSCDCPHDSPICKHIVASLFYLQKDLFADLTITSTKKKRGVAKPKKKSEAEQVKAILKVLPHEELKKVFYAACKKDSKLKLSFIAQHLHLLENESKELYTLQLQTLIKGYKGKFGFIDYRDARQLNLQIDELLNLANRSCEQNDFQKAFHIASAILETTVDLIDCSDDSGGYLSRNIENTIHLLEDLTESELDEELHNELLNYLLDKFTSNTFEGWNWWLDILDLAIRLTRSQAENEKVLSLLDSVMQKADHWYLEKFQDLKAKLILKCDGKEAADLYITNNTSNSYFRKRLIEEALAAKDYTKSEALAQDGVTQDDDKLPGLADEWRVYLLNIYLITGNTPKAIQLAHYFYLSGYGRFENAEYYYKLLKSLVQPDQWSGYVNRLADEVIDKEGLFYSTPYQLINLYIWEEEWDKLFALIKTVNSLPCTELISQHLPTSYTNQIIPIYKKQILEYVDYYVGRSYYQVVCQHIKKLMQMDADVADALILELKQTYSKRKALMEELNYILIE